MSLTFRGRHGGWQRGASTEEDGKAVNGMEMSREWVTRRSGTAASA